jgi:hypothetical protein
MTRKMVMGFTRGLMVADTTVAGTKTSDMGWE